MVLEHQEGLAEVERPAIDLLSAGSNVETTMSQPQDKPAALADADAMIGISGKGKKRKRAFSGGARSKFTIFMALSCSEMTSLPKQLLQDRR
jgi:hypothetical protein